MLLKELEQEAATTRKFLQLVPMDKLDYKPHEKSMVLKDLVVHIAELPGWVAYAINVPGLDFATMDYTPSTFNSTDELLNIFEKSLADGKQALQSANVESFNEEWTLRHGDALLAKWTRYETIRHSIAQIIHHRAQLGVYLRLNNIAIPGSYGPSADDPGM